MTVAGDFKAFCSNISIDKDTRDLIRSRKGQIAKRLNSDFWGTSSEDQHLIYVGSYGRRTETEVSDIDLLFVLPPRDYDKYSGRKYNGQSDLLQDVKNSLASTYPNTRMRGDGQVVVVSFSDGMTFEILPAFKRTDGTYLYPDTHNGGSWKMTNPQAEIDEITRMNKQTCYNLKRLCKMARAWRDENNVDIKGIQIDILAYEFLKDWQYNQCPYGFYNWMSGYFFEYLSNISCSRKTWVIPGSNRKITYENRFTAKAKESRLVALQALKCNNIGNYKEEKRLWSEIYGPRFK